MSKLFQIREDDLLTLETAVPALVARHEHDLSTKDKVAVRQIQDVLQKVRWNYGPHKEHFIDHDGGDAEGSGS